MYTVRFFNLLAPTWVRTTPMFTIIIEYYNSNML